MDGLGILPDQVGNPLQKVQGRMKKLWPFALIAMVTTVVFLPSLKNGFVNWDDYEYVVENPWIQSWSSEHLGAILTQGRGGNYHPLVFLSHLIEYSLWGKDPAGYHAVNLALHVVATASVFWLGILLSLSQGAALLAALWFGVHPLHVESVAWVAERKDVLCTAFYLLALLPLYSRSPKK